MLQKLDVLGLGGWGGGGSSPPFPGPAKTMESTTPRLENSNFFLLFKSRGETFEQPKIRYSRGTKRRKWGLKTYLF